jgi:hypothetical protein
MLDFPPGATSHISDGPPFRVVMGSPSRTLRVGRKPGTLPAGLLKEVMSKVRKGKGIGKRRTFPHYQYQRSHSSLPPSPYAYTSHPPPCPLALPPRTNLWAAPCSTRLLQLVRRPRWLCLTAHREVELLFGWCGVPWMRDRRFRLSDEGRLKGRS